MKQRYEARTARARVSYVHSSGPCTGRLMDEVHGILRPDLPGGIIVNDARLMQLAVATGALAPAILLALEELHGRRQLHMHPMRRVDGGTDYVLRPWKPGHCPVCRVNGGAR